MKSIRSILIIVLLSVLSFAQNRLPENLNTYVARVMETFEVPGISLAIVKDGQVLLAKGYGLKETGKKEPVNGETLFGIASNTKAFTATALAILVEEGRLDWDGPVIDYLPEFRLSDPYVTEELTIKDLLVHRSGLGLGAGDLLWWPSSTYDRKEIVHRLRYIPLKTSFRNAYAYDNVLYTVAGEVIERVSGLTWEEFLKQRILEPVGMTTSDVRHSAGSAGLPNIAAPHAIVEGKLVPVKPFTSDNVNPAGGIHSNAQDMARWMIVQLDSGRFGEDGQLFSEKSTEIIWSPVTPKPISEYAPEPSLLKTEFYFYALGFNVQDYRSRKMLTHTGGLPGYVSRLAMIPSLKLGVTVLTNQESGEAFNAITWYILDYYLGAESFDWLEVYRVKAELKSEKLAATMDRAESQRDKTSRPSLPLQKYTGTYRDTWYGDIVIRLDQGKLVMEFQHTPDLTGELEHWQYDTFVARWYDRSLRGDAFVSFMLKPNGSVEWVKMRPFSSAVDFSFDFQDLNLIPVADVR